MTEDTVKKVAKKLNIKHNADAPVEHIQNMIAQQPVASQRDAMRHVAETTAQPVFYNSPDEVEAAIEKYKKEGFVAKYGDDNTWYFSYKGCEDSGNLSIPLRVIVMKAEMVSKGRRLLRGHRIEEFGSGAGKGYADNVLMA